MTQQPFYPPQYPQAPQQVQQPYPPQQGFPQQPPAPQYPQQSFPAQAPQQQPTQPLAQGNLDDYFNQPSASTGPSISWTNADRSPKPIGTSYAGIVARDVTHADVQQQTDFNTKAPLYYRDGRPKFAMKVPLKVQPSQEFPDGEATWYVKGQARDELVRAMAEAGCEGAPKAGAVIQITLVARRNSGAGLNPANVVQVRYQPPQGGQQAPQATAPVQQQQAQVTDAPSPAPVPQQAAPQYQPQQGQVLNVDQAIQAQPQQAPAPQPAAPQAAAPQPPSDLSPEQQALLAQLTGGQNPAA